MRSVAAPLPRASDRLSALAWVLLLCLSFAGLGRGLWTPDEPREAEISREMYLAPSVVPTLNGGPFLEKPPLYYWAVAGVFHVAGTPSVAAARAVSEVAACLTLLLVYLWGGRAHSQRAGLLASVMLATSMQFLICAHWVLMDPLLMLLTTVMAWSGWELVSGGARGYAVWALSAAAVLALWTKGLIGPVLCAAGLAVYCLLERRERPWRRLPWSLPLGTLVAAFLMLVLLIYRDGGATALRQWLWVNHVQRFLDPQDTGHVQPLPYYLWTLPFALLPWLVPFVDACRPSCWRRRDAARTLRHYCGALAAGMIAVLSASSTKRGTYLLPVLPVLFLLMGANLAQAWRDDAGATSRWRWWGWWIQCGLCWTFAAAAALGACVYLRALQPLALAQLLVVTALGIAAIVTARRRAWAQTSVALGVCALVGALGTILLIGRVLDPEKDMAPYISRIDAVLPANQALVTLGTDETLEAIVPFVTGRRVVPTDCASLARLAAARLPPAVLVQGKSRRDTGADLRPLYVRGPRRSFGPARTLTLWQRCTGGCGPADGEGPRASICGKPSPDPR